MLRRNAGLLGFAALLISAVGGGTAVAERPAAPHLLPEKTLVYARVADANEFREAFQQSSLGRMLRDEQMRPLTGELYSGAASLFDQVSEQIGVSLDELLSIPQGELAFAVVPLEDPQLSEEDGPKDDSPDAVRKRIEARRNRSPLGVVAVIESGDKTPLLRRMVERLENQLQQDGFQRSKRKVAGAEVVEFARGQEPPFSYAEREGVLIFGIGLELVDDVLSRWDGEDRGKTLAQNTDFGNVMSHCVGAEASQPQVTFYADPYHFAEQVTRASGGTAAFVWTALTSLELDKLKGIGGSLFTGGDEGFESILHLHLLLDSPRDGLLSVVRPGEGSLQPEDWVPADVVSYTTLHWDILKTYEGVARIMSRFQGEDAMEQNVATPFKERTGLDLRADVLEQLTGRLGMIRWNEPPARLNSQTQVWAVQVKDIAVAQPTLEKLNSAYGESFRKESFGGKTIYVRSRVARNALPEGLRRPEPTLAIIGDYIIGSDSRKSIEHLIQAHGGSIPRLSHSPEYDLIAGEISGKLDSQKPFMFSFLRSEEVFRQIYELAKAPGSRAFLKQAGENNPAAKMLVDALERNELPAFSAFSKYFAPSGAFAYDDPTGLHYATFTLQPIE